MHTPVKEARSLRALIEELLKERFDTKAEKLVEDDPKRQTLTEQFSFEAWIDNAARRVSQLQVVTHSLKPIHPDAKGTNLYVSPETLTRHHLVGSHALPEDFQADVVGNAAALDVYKFLKLKHDGKSLLERVLEEDAELASALSDDPEQAREWIRAFAAITESRGEVSSHANAKQLYWLSEGNDPTDDRAYHLLAPLYATSLAHRVFQIINEDRFGEPAKLAREARHKNLASDTGFRDYPDLAVQKLGGTKPQNISQLNSERGGNNYLLVSLSPKWEWQSVVLPCGVDSVFDLFERHGEVGKVVRHLKWYLGIDPSPTIHVRQLRDEINASLVEELMIFGGCYQQLLPGWSADKRCRIPEAEKLWLDPGRAALDEAFHQARRETDWPSEIRKRFANWLNQRLELKLPMGDAEHRHWDKTLERDPSFQRWLERDRRWMESLERELDDWQEGMDHE